MFEYRHSVSLESEKCKGCTNCLKRCPTEAIRIRFGHAVIKSERCIDCGECIRVCPYHAKKALYDRFESLNEYKYKIALPAPALYGQFDNLDDLDYVLTGLLDCGFDSVFEVARAAEIISEYTRRYIREGNVKKPIISSACPAVVRLISARFPSLCDHVLPMLPPVELAARMAKTEALKEHPELEEQDIGVFFISPCPAKVSYVRNPIGVSETAIDGVLSMSDTYFKLVSAMNKIKSPQSLSMTGIIGISWAGTGGEAAALFNDKYLAADGIENVIKVLDEMENDQISGIEFIELNACNGGCVGGALTVENPYIAKARLQNLRRYLPVSQNHITNAVNISNQSTVPADVMWDKELEYDPVFQLSKNTGEAIRKMSEIQKIYPKFPHLDCGSCGAPSCRALAEDIVNNEAEESDCIINMRDELKKYYKMFDTSRDKIATDENNSENK